MRTNVTNDLSEIPDLPIGKIETFEDLIKLNEFVFTLIPWKINPAIKTSWRHTLAQFYRGCKKRALGGWCGLHVDFLRRLLRAYGIQNRKYNHGLQQYKITHVVAIVKLGGIEYLLDPYFCRYYTTLKGDPIPFPVLFDLIKHRKFDNIKSIFSNIQKQVERPGNEWEQWTGQQLAHSVINAWKVNRVFDERVKEAFGGTSELLLLLRGVK